MTAGNSAHRPPRFSAWILEKLFPDRGMYSTAGDLQEIFLFEVEKRGLRRARLWYRLQLLKSLPHRFLGLIFLDLPMFLISLKIMFRSLRKHKAFSLLTILALTLGLTCFFLIFLYVRYETAYDSFHPEAARIFRLNLEDPPGDGRARAAGPSPHLLESRIPEIEATVQTLWGFNPVVKREKVKFETSALFVEPEFLDLFRFPLRRGSNRSLAEPGQVILSERTSRRLFRTDEPIGRSLDFIVRGDPCRLTVSGIMSDPPANTHFRFDVLISNPTAATLPGYKPLLQAGRNRFPTTYVKLRAGASVRTAAEKTADVLDLRMESPKSGPGVRAVLQPVTDIHLRPDGKNDGAARTLNLFLSLSVLILAVAVINYINLATSRSSLRRREIGIRKTVGAQRRQLFRQFVGEAVVVTAGAFVLALAALAVLLPAFNRMMERDIPFARLLGGAGVFEFAGILLLVGAAAGFYPALVLSSFRPARILKGKDADGRRTSRLRDAFVVVQFTSAVVLVVLTLCLYGQIRFIRAMDVGLRPGGIVETWAGPPEGLLVKRRLNQNPRIAGVTLVSNQVVLNNRGAMSEMWGKVSLSREAAENSSEIPVFHLRCDADFLPVFGIRLARGRNFSPERDERSSAVVNATLARLLGFPDPLGKTIRSENRDLTIIGVIEDFHFQPLQRTVGPALLTFTDSNYGVLYAKFRPTDSREALAAVQGALDEFVPDDIFPVLFLEDRISSLYKPEFKQAALLSLFSVLAVVIAGLGLLGLAAFGVERRTREIGIRKFLGAGTGRLFLLLTGNFGVLLAAAHLLAWPAAYYFASRWLSNFAYHAPIRVSTFALAAAGILGLTIPAAATQIFKIARIDPIETLKYE